MWDISLQRMHDVSAVDVGAHGSCDSGERRGRPYSSRRAWQRWRRSLSVAAHCRAVPREGDARGAGSPPRQAAEVYRAEDPAVLLTPALVLVDGHSASASEIVAGSLQRPGSRPDRRNRSFGKGLVQTSNGFAERWAVRRTTGKWSRRVGGAFRRSRRGWATAGSSTLRQTEYRSTAGRRIIGGGGVTPESDRDAGHGGCGGAHPGTGSCNRVGELQDMGVRSGASCRRTRAVTS